MSDKISRRVPAVLPTNVRRPRAAAQHLLGVANVAVFVDGYNFVFSLWPESKNDIGAARRRLEQRLRHMAARASLDVTVVWDGVQDSNAVPVRRRHHRAEEGGVSVVFSPIGYEADDTIVLSCEVLPPTRPIVVVTFDRELRQRVAEVGANVISPSSLLQLMPRPAIDDVQVLKVLTGHRASLQELLLHIDPATVLKQAIHDGTIREIVPEILVLREIPDEGCEHRDTLAHTIAVVERTPADLSVRFAALMQDIGKPATLKARDGKYTFRFHEVVGARMAAERLESLQFNCGIVDDVRDLIEMSNRLDGSTQWTDSAVRRFVNDAGNLRARICQLVWADREARGGQATHGAQELDNLEQRIQQVAAADAVAAERPQIDGNEIMDHLGIGSGPQVGKAVRWLKDLRRLDGDLPHDELLQRLDIWWQIESSRAGA